MSSRTEQSSGQNIVRCIINSITGTDSDTSSSLVRHRIGIGIGPPVLGGILLLLGFPVRWWTVLLSDEAGGESIADGTDPDVEHVVTGTVTQCDEPLESVVVRAFDRDVANEEFLGETTTDECGQYRISYTGDDVAANERGSGDLVVSVFNEVDTLLAESAVQFNVAQQMTIDIQVPDTRTVVPSEYQRLKSEVEPLLDDRSVAGLSDDQLNFLADELALSSRQAYPSGVETLQHLQAAEQLARETPFDTAVLYGIARTAPDVDRTYLLESSPDVLADRVAVANDANIIQIDTEELGAEIEAKLEQLRQVEELESGEEVATTIEIVDDDGVPLAGRTVLVTDPGNDRKQLTVTTDADGRTGFTYTVPPDSDDSKREFELSVINQAGVILQEDTRTVDEGSATRVTVSESSAGHSGAATLEGLKGSDSLSLPDDTDVPDVTLGAIRRAGGVKNFDGLGDIDEVTQETIDAVATLDLMTDPATASTLAEHGYTDQRSISETPLVEFQSTMEDSFDMKQAATIHTQAQAQTHLFDSILTEQLAAVRNGTTPAGPLARRDGGSTNGN